MVAIDEDVFVDSVEDEAKANKELVFQNPILLSVNQLLESVCYHDPYLFAFQTTRGLLSILHGKSTLRLIPHCEIIEIMKIDSIRCCLLWSYGLNLACVWDLQRKKQRKP